MFKFFIHINQYRLMTPHDKFASVKKKMCKPCSDVCINDPTKLWEEGIVPYKFDNNGWLLVLCWQARRRTGIVSYQGLAHPIGSAMHELLHACGSCMKLKSEVKRDFEIGQREMLSEGDIKAINMLYLDSTPDIQRVKITASNEEMKLQFLLKIKSKIFRRKRSQ
ncbi:unnamed protein product [Rhizophagus irregularis]|nr:unnamed protein product [Rhizophagus irregularis]